MIVVISVTCLFQKKHSRGVKHVHVHFREKPWNYLNKKSKIYKNTNQFFDKAKPDKQDWNMMKFGCVVVWVILLRQLCVYAFYRVGNIINLLHYILFTAAMSVERREHLAVSATKNKISEKSIEVNHGQTSNTCFLKFGIEIIFTKRNNILNRQKNQKKNFFRIFGPAWWKSVISRLGNPAFEENYGHLLQLCCNNELCIRNTFFQHKDVHKYTWCRPSMGQKLLICFALFRQICFRKCWMFEWNEGRNCQLITTFLFALYEFQGFPNKKSHRYIVACRIIWEILADKDVRKQFAPSMATNSDNFRMFL